MTEARPIRPHSPNNRQWQVAQVVSQAQRTVGLLSLSLPFVMQRGLAYMANGRHYASCTLLFDVAICPSAVFDVWFLCSVLSAVLRHRQSPCCKYMHTTNLRNSMRLGFVFCFPYCLLAFLMMPAFVSTICGGSFSRPLLYSHLRSSASSFFSRRRTRHSPLATRECPCVA